MARAHKSIVFDFAANATLSESQSLKSGAFGTLLVPAALAGKTLNFVTDVLTGPGSKGMTTPADFDGVELLATPITLVEGANPLNADQIAAVGAAGYVKLKLNSSIGTASQIVLLWKD